MVLESLKPQSVFHFFEEFCAIPHGSGNTKQISDYLVRFAEERNLFCHQDALNSVIIRKSGSKGREQEPPVILQGHMDMVCEQAPDCTKDMTQEGLTLKTDGEWVWAEGTTLGGDDGIFDAMALALLDDDSISHPPLEAVFTVDEETGMYGAHALDMSLLKGERMINLDSEEEGIFIVSCAGGATALCTLPVKREPWEGEFFRLTVSNLTGGHSGTEINKGRLNADTLLGRILCELQRKLPIRIAVVKGGLKNNAIPNSAEAVFAVQNAEQAKKVCKDLSAAISSEYAVTEPSLKIEIAAADPEPLTDEEGTKRIICFLNCVPNGIQEMSASVPGLVQTSLNLGILKSDENEITAEFCVRSSIDSQKQALLERLCCFTAQLDGTVQIDSEYPGWAYREKSPLRDLLAAVYEEQYGKKPVIEAMHAGVECGLFVGAIPNLDCVSIGPNLLDIHTYREHMDVASVERTWNLLVETLRRM